MDENTAAGQNVGAALTATDTDNDTLTYSLEGTDAASFDIVPASGQIRTKTGVSYSYEAQTSYAVTVKADDGFGGTDTVAVTIALTDVDEQPDKPAAPTLEPVSGSTTSLTANWMKPGLNGGPDITGYDVRYRQGTSGGWNDFTHDGAGVTATITGLTADTEYQVQVRAKNEETPSDWSDPSDAVRTNAEGGTPTPQITNVAVTSSPRLETDTYGEGETIEISVTFDEAVNATSDPGLRAVRVGAPSARRWCAARARRRWCSATPCSPGTAIVMASGSGTRTGLWSATATGTPRTARSRAWPPARRRT